MDIIKWSANTRKLKYAIEAYENHDCTGDGCERCKNAETSTNEAINNFPQWFVKPITIVVTVVYYTFYYLVMCPYHKLVDTSIGIWCRLFHNHIPGKGSE